jgi:hypothetical protein
MTLSLTSTNGSTVLRTGMFDLWVARWVDRNDKPIFTAYRADGSFWVHIRRHVVVLSAPGRG